MLRIIEFREPLVTKLRFEGALTCEDSLEVRERVLSVTQAVPDKPVLLDLGDLHKADPCGELLLRELDAGGVRLNAYGGAARELLERIRSGGKRAYEKGAFLRRWLGRIRQWILPATAAPEAAAE